MKTNEKNDKKHQTYRKAITVNSPILKTRECVSNPDSLPLVFPRIRQVKKENSGVYRLIIRGDKRGRLQVHSRNNDERLDFKLSFEGEPIGNGEIQFQIAPDGERTELHCKISVPSTWKNSVAPLRFLEKVQWDRDLYQALSRFRALVETGGIPTIKGQPTGRTKQKESERNEPIQKEVA